jgi:hypothetical protein
MVVSGSRSRSAAGPVEVAGSPGVDAGLRRDLVGGLGPLGIVGHHAGDGTAGERDQLGQAPAAGTQLGQVDGAPGAGAEVHADELLTAGGLAGDKQPRRHPAPPQGSAGACAPGAGPERRSCSTTAPRSSAARPPAPAALADAGPLGLPRRARRRPRPETSQPSHGVPRSPRPSRHRGHGVLASYRRACRLRVPSANYRIGTTGRIDRTTPVQQGARRAASSRGTGGYRRWWRDRRFSTARNQPAYRRGWHAR